MTKKKRLAKATRAMYHLIALVEREGEFGPGDFEPPSFADASSEQCKDVEWVPLSGMTYPSHLELMVLAHT